MFFSLACVRKFKNTIQRGSHLDYHSGMPELVSLPYYVVIDCLSHLAHTREETKWSRVKSFKFWQKLKNMIKSRITMLSLNLVFCIIHVKNLHLWWKKLQFWPKYVNTCLKFLTRNSFWYFKKKWNLHVKY